MTIFTAATIGTITTITILTGVENSETFSAMRELNKKEAAIGCGISWSICKDVGDVVIDYQLPCHHVIVERVHVLDALA